MSYFQLSFQCWKCDEAQSLVFDIILHLNLVAYIYSVKHNQKLPQIPD